MGENLSKSAFSEAVKTKFRILDRESPTVIEVVLAEVNEGRSSEKHEQFSLLFKGPAEPVLAQKTYAIEHAAMGDFDLFLVPVGADENGASYEAVFNRLLK